MFTGFRPSSVSEYTAKLDCKTFGFCVFTLMHRVTEPLCEPNFLCVFVVRIGEDL